MSEQNEKIKTVGYEKILSVNKEAIEPELEVIVSTRSKVRDNDLKNISGIKIHTKNDKFFTATIPINRITDLSKLNGVSFIEASTRCNTLLDVSVPETKADQVRNTLAYKGKNVIVGIVDTGIDFKHYDFRNSDGTSRIKYLWDQTLSPVSGESVPSGYGYGVEYNQNQVNNSMSGLSVREQDSEEGHGTHVAGIAAGNGLETGNSKPSGTYTGVATEADIIIVKTTMTTSAIIDGVSYIFSKAGSLNQPCVVNLSLGSHSGSHDGKSSFETSLENLLGKGKIIVAAAGNSGNSAIHTSGTATATVQFNAMDTSLSYITIWYSGSNSLTVKVKPPNASEIGPINPGDPTSTTSTIDGRVIIQSSTNMSYNNDKNILIQIDNGAGTPVNKTGTWNFTLTGSGRFNAWSPDETYTTFVNPDYDYTITMPATVAKIISVASYNTKNTWKDINNTSHSTTEKVADISSFSSRGPTRDDRNKPDISAPGSVIASSMSSSVSFTDSLIMPDSKHVAMNGTSMAAPHVSGAIALLLQKNRNLTPEEVISALTTTTTKDANTGSSWNKYWGNGKLNALAAINSITNSQVSDPAITEHFTYPNPVRGNKASIKYNTNINAEAVVKIYNIAGELVAKLSGDVAIGYNQIDWDITDVAPGIYFYIIYLKSRDDGREIETKPAKIAIIK